MARERMKPSNGQGEVTAGHRLDLRNNLPYRLTQLSNLMAFGSSRANVADFGFNVREWRVLTMVGAVQPCTAADVAFHTGMDKATVSRALKELTRQGLIGRIADRHDRRRQMLALTEKGAAANDLTVPVAEARARRFADGLRPEERRTLTALLDKLLVQARDVIADEAARPDDE